MFRVPPLMVTSDMRRNAKAVNFGIVYGQTPFGLAASLGIDRKEAEEYIRTYFELHAGVKKFIQETIAKVRETGFAPTLFGRKRPIPDMHSRNPNARSFAERTAVNTPLQGTAADLIKLAMIRIDEILRREKLETKMLLQVHDELLFESPPAEAKKVSELVKREMENVHKLDVPLIVDVGDRRKLAGCEVKRAAGLIFVVLLCGCSKPAQAPAEFKVRFDTSKGPFVLEVHREWAPNGVDRFYELVKSGYYDEARFFRVVPNFVVQWGINKDPKVSRQWNQNYISDDPVKESNRRGYITYAKRGPDTRTTQLFINLADNVSLDAMGFAPFGKVTEGMDVVQNLYSGYGQTPQQDLIQLQGNDYLQSQFPQLDYIKTARVEQ